MSSGRKRLGRQKIEMKKMSNERSLKVTFSKRRSGLFKKASELCTLCGPDVAIVVFSPSEKVYSFGYPYFDMVIDRYLSRAPPQNSGTMQFIEAHRRANMCELNTQLTHNNNALDIEKRRRDELRCMQKMIEAQFWWTCPVDGMNMAQLKLFQMALEGLKKLIAQQVAQQAAQQADRLINQGTLTQTLPFVVGNGSSSNMPLQHQQNPQMFSTQFFHNPMLQPHLFDFNNMGGGGGYGPPGFI